MIPITLIFIAFSIALIALVFGAKLHAQTNRENLGSMYKYISWFVMIMAFIIVLCSVAHIMMSCCHHGDGRMMHRECMMDRGCMMERGCMMDKNCNDPCMMGGGGMGCPMMNHCNMGNMNEGNNCCNGMMNNMGGKCADGMMNCPDGKGGMNSGCQMGDMKCKGDTSKKK